MAARQACPIAILCISLGPCATTHSVCGEAAKGEAPCQPKETGHACIANGHVFPGAYHSDDGRKQNFVSPYHLLLDVACYFTLSLFLYF